MKKAHNKGFTLIELLVVIAIIGILSSVVLVSLGTARAKARDANRTSDLKSIQTALVLYADEYNNTYPTSTSALSRSDKRFGLNVLPKDPLTGKDYYYYIYEDGRGKCTRYHLGANLENDNNSVLAGDSDLDSTGTNSCGGTPFKGNETADPTKPYCDDSGVTVSADGYCYDLTE
jgi:prepilin-type N-terminal cleavage/methylation domain-containing protein